MQENESAKIHILCWLFCVLLPLHCTALTYEKKCSSLSLAVAEEIMCSFALRGKQMHHENT